MDAALRSFLRSLPSIATALCLVGAGAPAQGDAAAPREPRRPVAGLVTDADGAAVAGAAVTLVGAVASPVWDAPPDLLQATTDARGRFRVLVRECVEYTAWASTADRTSELLLGVVPGPRAELVLRHAPRASIPVDGLEPWHDRGPLRARLWPDGGSGYRVEAAITDGALQLPAGWPHARFTFELLAADGSAIQMYRYGAAIDRIGVAAPRELLVLVEDPAGQPVAGAEVWVDRRVHAELAELGSTRHVLRLVVGTTGADGRCRARVGAWWTGDDPKRSLSVNAGMAGFAAAYGGYDYQARPFSEGLGAESGADAPFTEDGALRLRLRPERPLAGRLTIAGEPIAACPVSVVTNRTVMNEKVGVGYSVETPVVTATDAEGRFTVPGVGDDVVKCIQIGAHDGVWGGEVPRSAAPGQPLLAPPGGGAALDFDLAQCARVAVQGLLEDGGPAANAVLVVLPLTDSPGSAGDDSRYRLDPAGRATLLLQRDVTWFVIALDGTRVHVGQLTPQEASERLDVTLTELPRLRVRALDAERQPVAGARFGYSSYTYVPAPTPEDRQLTMLAFTLYQRSFDRARSDADGWLELPMFREDWTRFTVYVQKDAARSTPWPLQYAADPLEVELRGQ